jgi:hypothetical protein
VIKKQDKKNSSDVYEKESRSSTIADVVVLQRPTRLPPSRILASQSHTGSFKTSQVPCPPAPQTQPCIVAPMEPPVAEIDPSSVSDVNSNQDNEMDVEQPEAEVEAMIEVIDSSDEEDVVASVLTTTALQQEYIWPEFSPAHAERYANELQALQQQFQDEDEVETTLVPEYAEDIFRYMGELEVSFHITTCSMKLTIAS